MMHDFVNWQMLPYAMCWILKKANQIIIFEFCQLQLLKQLLIKQLLK